MQNTNLKVKIFDNLGEVLFNQDDSKVSKALDMLDKAAKNGKFFSVQFIKKDGTLRDMQARMNVQKHLKGGVKTLGNNYICVFDVKAESYRAVNPQTIQKVNGVQV